MTLYKSNGKNLLVENSGIWHKLNCSPKEAFVGFDELEISYDSESGYMYFTTNEP